MGPWQHPAWPYLSLCVEPSLLALGATQASKLFGQEFAADPGTVLASVSLIHGRKGQVFAMCFQGLLSTRFYPATPHALCWPVSPGG